MIQDYNFYFNCFYTKDLGLILSEYPNIPALIENIEETEIEGRDGVLIEKLGTFQNRKISCTFKIIDDQEYNKKLAIIKSWIRNIKENKLYINNDKYFLVENVEADEIRRELGKEAEITINFICKPFLYSEEIIRKDTNKTIDINNFGDYATEPIIIIYGSGNIKLAVNEEAMTIEKVKDLVVINSKLKTVTDANGLSKDWDTIGNFPILEAGKNNITVSGATGEIIIKYNEKYY